MSAFVDGFGDELIKVAVLGGLKRMGKFTVKHPLLTLGAGATIAGTALAARAGHQQGMSGEEKKRYLAATKDSPSRAAFTDYNSLFGTEKSKGISKNYKRKAFA